MEKTRRYGSGRPLFWAHVAGPSERRGSVRFADTAFELMPLATPRHPYENILLVDLATHPRLIPAETLTAMLTPGIYLTDTARTAMPALAGGSMTKRTTTSGESVWEILDTTTAFAEYWKDEEPLDVDQSVLEAQHRRIRALAEGYGTTPINAFPVSYGTVISLRDRRIFTLDDLVALDIQGVLLQCGLERYDLALAYRIIRSTLETRGRDAHSDGLCTAA